MAIKSIVYGGANSSTRQSLSTLIREFAPVRFQNLVNLACPTLRDKVLAKEDCEDEVTWTLFGGSKSSMGFIADGGTLPVPAAKRPYKPRAVPSYLVGTIRLGRGVKFTNFTAKGLAKTVDQNINIAMESAQQLLCRAIFGGAVSPKTVGGGAGAEAGSWSGTAADSTVTLLFEDISMFREDQAYDLIDASANLAYVVRATAVTPASSDGSGHSTTNSDAVAGTVTFINDIPNPDSSTNAVTALGSTNVSTSDSFRVRGSTLGFGGSSAVIDGQALISFDDVAGSSSSTSTLYGISPSTDVTSHKGQYKSIGAPWTQEAVASYMARMNQVCGKYPTDVIMSPQLGVAHQASGGVHGAMFGVSSLSITAARPQNLDRNGDKYGNVTEAKLTVGGRPITLDPNVQATRAIFHNRETCKLGVWGELDMEEEAGDAMLLNRTSFNNDWQLSGAYQLLAYARNTIGMLDGFTNL